MIFFASIVMFSMPAILAQATEPCPDTNRCIHDMQASCVASEAMQTLLIRKDQDWETKKKLLGCVSMEMKNQNVSYEMPASVSNDACIPKNVLIKCKVQPSRKNVVKRSMHSDQPPTASGQMGRFHPPRMPGACFVQLFGQPTGGKRCHFYAIYHCVINNQAEVEEAASCKFPPFATDECPEAIGLIIEQCKLSNGVV